MKNTKQETNSNFGKKKKITIEILLWSQNLENHTDTILAPTAQNGQTLKQFVGFCRQIVECVCPFCGVGA